MLQYSVHTHMARPGPHMAQHAKMSQLCPNYVPTMSQHSPVAPNSPNIAIHCPPQRPPWARLDTAQGLLVLTPKERRERRVEPVARCEGRVSHGAVSNMTSTVPPQTPHGNRPTFPTFGCRLLQARKVFFNHMSILVYLSLSCVLNGSKWIVCDDVY